MKKVLATAMALAMLASAVTINAGAAYPSDPNHFTDDTSGLNSSNAGISANGAKDPIASKDVEVKIQTSGDVNTTHVYAISYSHTELTFTYKMGGTRVWNPETLKYENKDGGGTWNRATQEITVKNYSDLGVKITAAVNQDGLPEQGNVTVTAAKKTDGGAEIVLASAYNSDNPQSSVATEGIFEVKVDGSPVNEYTTAVKMATITLTVNKNNGP